MGDSINQLPDDCLEHIFSFLSIKERLEIERVCKRWRNIGEKGWPDRKIVQFSNESDNMIYSFLKRCGRFLRNLEIRLRSENPGCLSMVIQFCRLEQLQKIVIYCKSASSKKQQEFEMFNLRDFFESAKNLEDIKIYGNLGIYGIDYLHFVNPTTLRKLEIKDENGSELLFKPDRFINLNELKLKSIKIDRDAKRTMKESWKRLEIMSIRYCSISRGFIESIQNFTNLQKLVLTNNICDIKNTDIREIANHCDKMKEMTLSAIDLTGECFQYLGEMPKLEILYLQNFSIVNILDVVHLKNVRKLTFDYYSGFPMDDGLIQLITNSSNLEELSLLHIRALNSSFINNVQLIFRRGLRQKHLYFAARILFNYDHPGYNCPIAIDEPLLKLRVDSFG